MFDALATEKFINCPGAILCPKPCACPNSCKITVSKSYCEPVANPGPNCQDTPVALAWISISSIHQTVFSRLQTLVANPENLLVALASTPDGNEASNSTTFSLSFAYNVGVTPAALQFIPVLHFHVFKAFSKATTASGLA